MRLVSVAPKMLYETIAISHFARLLMPALLAAGGIAARMSHSHAYLFCVLPHGFSRKRETAHSLTVSLLS